MKAISNGDIFRKDKSSGKDKKVFKYDGKIAYGSPNEKKVIKYSADPFKDFCQWLHPTGAVDIVIDGLNVGYSRNFISLWKVIYKRSKFIMIVITYN